MVSTLDQSANSGSGHGAVMSERPPSLESVGVELGADDARRSKRRAGRDSMRCSKWVVWSMAYMTGPSCSVDLRPSAASPTHRPGHEDARAEARVQVSAEMDTPNESGVTTVELVVRMDEDSTG